MDWKLIQTEESVTSAIDQVEREIGKRSGDKEVDDRLMRKKNTSELHAPFYKSAPRVAHDYDYLLTSSLKVYLVLLKTCSRALLPAPSVSSD